MEPKHPEPPPIVETTAYVFDRKTGEILATHTRWTERGASKPEVPVSRELLKSIADDAGRPVAGLDVLAVKAPPSRTPLRVDVAKRKIVPARREKTQERHDPGEIGKP